MNTLKRKSSPIALHLTPSSLPTSFPLHGLGFASSLLAIGLPEQHVPAALLFFKVGLEMGQLGVIALVIVLRLLATRLRLRPDWVRRGVVYALDGMAGYWSIERILAAPTGC